MPLENSGSKQARQRNIRREIAAGKPVKQAVAIGYSIQERALGKHVRDAKRRRTKNQ